MVSSSDEEQSKGKGKGKDESPLPLVSSSDEEQSKGKGKGKDEGDEEQSIHHDTENVGKGKAREGKGVRPPYRFNELAQRWEFLV